MLKIIVPGEESWDAENRVFVTIGDVELELEHSLVSLSKWESEFEKPLLSEEKKTDDEIFAYFKAMTLTPDVPPEVFDRLSSENLNQINSYISGKMTATWFREEIKQPKSSETITAELVYYWMFTCGIPMECENWHLSRLFTLIRIFNVKNSKPQKRSPAEIAAERRRLNEERRKQYGTTG